MVVVFPIQPRKLHPRLTLMAHRKKIPGGIVYGTRTPGDFVAVEFIISAHCPESLEIFPIIFPANRTETQYRGTRTPGDFVATEFPGHATVRFLKLSDSGSVYFH